MKGKTKKSTAVASARLSKRSGENPALQVAAASANVDVLLVDSLVRDVGVLIESARAQVAVVANAALTTLYWQIGRRGHTEVLDGKRGEYGARIVAAVGRELERRYGRGFGENNLRRMVQFAAVFRTPRLSPHCGDIWVGPTSNCSSR